MAHTIKPWEPRLESEGIWVSSLGVGEDANVICDIVTRSGNSADYDEEDEANAHLIAAAPDLLDALEELVAYLDAGDARSNRFTGLMVVARSAIAKAKAMESKA